MDTIICNFLFKVEFFFNYKIRFEIDQAIRSKKEKMVKGLIVSQSPIGN